LSPRAKLAVVAVPVIVIVAVLVSLLLLGGGGGKGGKPPNTKLVAAKRTYCHDLSVLQNGFRPDALARFLVKMKRDESLFQAARDHPTAKNIAQIRAAAVKLKAAVERNTGVDPAGSALERAISLGPSCT
jgi:hypothetical protein